MTSVETGAHNDARMHWAYALVPQWAVRRVLVPRGLFGRISSLMMRRINREMNEQMVSLLELRGDERVLEIGFGPGVGVQLLLAALPDGSVAGVDASPLMLRQASRRNAAALRAGRADLREALATDLPFDDASVDAACSANSVQLWGDLDRAFAELARVLVPGGRIVMTVHDWAADDLDGQIRSALAGNPFEAVDVRNTVDAAGTTIHVTARKAGPR